MDPQKQPKNKSPVSSSSEDSAVTAFFDSLQIGSPPHQQPKSPNPRITPQRTPNRSPRPNAPVYTPPVINHYLLPGNVIAPPELRQVADQQLADLENSKVVLETEIAELEIAIRELKQTLSLTKKEITMCKRRQVASNRIVDVRATKYSRIDARELNRKVSDERNDEVEGECTVILDHNTGRRCTRVVHRTFKQQPMCRRCFDKALDEAG